MRHLLPLLLFLCACQTGLLADGGPTQPIAAVDMAQAADAAPRVDMATAHGDLSPSCGGDLAVDAGAVGGGRPAGRPVGAVCGYTDECYGDYGQGKCIIERTGPYSFGEGHCYAVVDIESTDDAGISAAYCQFNDSNTPKTCCVSTNVTAAFQSEVTGYDLNNQPCDIGFVALDHGYQP